MDNSDVSHTNCKAFCQLSWKKLGWIRNKLSLCQMAKQINMSSELKWGC